MIFSGDRQFLRSGFTIIETVVVIFVFTLVWGAVMVGIAAVYRTQGYAIQQSRAIDEARRGVEIMSREIRQAQYGENGAFPIELAADKQIVFYSDVDGDGRVERARYFIATVNSGSLTQSCSSGTTGGACSVNFSNFLTGTLTSAQVQVSLEGYFGSSSRYVELFADSAKLANMCTACNQCAGAWQGTQTFNVTSAAADNNIQFIVDGTSFVRNQCNWQIAGHSVRAQFQFIWAESIPNQDNSLKKSVIEPTGNPVTYPAAQEKISTVSSYVRNAPPIFTYYDEAGDQITSNPALLRDTRMMKLFMTVNVDPTRPPNDYQLEQYIQMRNLK